MSFDLVLGKFIKIVLAVVISMVVGAWVVVCMWEWFVVPKFNLEPLSIIEAAGLTIFCGFVFNRDKYEDSGNSKLTEKIVFSIIYPLMVLLFAWIVSLAM